MIFIYSIFNKHVKAGANSFKLNTNKKSWFVHVAFTVCVKYFTLHAIMLANDVLGTFLWQGLES